MRSLLILVICLIPIISCGGPSIGFSDEGFCPYCIMGSGDDLFSYEDFKWFNLQLQWGAANNQADPSVFLKWKCIPSTERVKRIIDGRKYGLDWSVCCCEAIKEPPFFPDHPATGQPE